MTTTTSSSFDLQKTLADISAAVAAQKISKSAEGHLREWLTEPRYSDYAPQVAALVAKATASGSDRDWREIDDAFWTVIPFGTGGRRGKMFPVGSNAINDRTIGESAQGLADYVRQQLGSKSQLACAIGYDTRHRSRHFAELCAEVMVAAGFRVEFLDGYRSTPELSYTVRQRKCDCGIMVTASHNPPSDNAVKVYWSTGGQLLPPHDQGVIDFVAKVEAIRRTPFADAVKAGKVVFCQDECDTGYQQAVLKLSKPGPRDLSILYSPMHGVGGSSVVPVLHEAGFEKLEIFGPHAEPNGDFPNVPGHVSNPENPKTFDAPIERARASGADIVMSSDPDADRLGCAAPLTLEKGSPWQTISGNQIGALLCEFELARRKKAGTLSPQHYIVTTLVTTALTRRIGESYGVQVAGDCLVGFKWIVGVIDERGPEGFVYATEESHGYLAGTHVRDKDAAVASLLMAELAAECKAAGKTLHQQLDSLFWQYGAHAERTISQTMPGSEGMARMQALMAALREKLPREIGGIRVTQCRDYENQRTIRADGSTGPLTGPVGDLVIFDLEQAGNYLAVRPSGTEPKVKFYMFAYEPPEQLANLEDTKRELEARLDRMEQDVKAIVKQHSE